MIGMNQLLDYNNNFVVTTKSHFVSSAIKLTDAAANRVGLILSGINGISGDIFGIGSLHLGPLSNWEVGVITLRIENGSIPFSQELSNPDWKREFWIGKHFNLPLLEWWADAANHPMSMFVTEIFFVGGKTCL